MKVPREVKVALWSYDVNKMDEVRDKRRIITNVLNRGASEAVAWVRSHYSVGDLRVAISNPIPGEWNRRSLNYWRLMYVLERP